MLIDALESRKAEWAPAPTPPTMKAVLEALRWAERRDGDNDGTRFRRMGWDAGIEFFGSQRSGSSISWGFLFDIIHHRGQLAAYLRPMGSTVPQVYGPTADEP